MVLDKVEKALENNGLLEPERSSIDRDIVPGLIPAGAGEFIFGAVIFLAFPAHNPGEYIQNATAFENVYAPQQEFDAKIMALLEKMYAERDQHAGITGTVPAAGTGRSAGGLLLPGQPGFREG